MPRNNMPEDWQPPAPAWQAKWDKEDDFVVGYFGIQAESVKPLSDWAEVALKAEHAPMRVERGTFIDKKNVKTHLYTIYWKMSEYQLWWALEANCAWWKSTDRENDGVGYFREIITMSRERFETLNSSPVPHGISATADEMEGPIEEHGYAGGMRDRIPLSATQSLRNAFDTNVKLDSHSFTNEKRVVVIPPKNMCVIRSGQNWTECDDDQRHVYLSKVHPTLKKGMAFLQNNPEKTSCFSMRLVDVKDQNWQPLDQTFGLGYATDVYAFEEWAKSHPTHIAILDRFMEMVVSFGENLQLKLWHEVIVLPSSGCEFEYIGCHADTGLLAYTD
jgi:aldoxime dehydratase